MTPTELVLASVALGLAAGALITFAIILASAALKRRKLSLRPELPEVATQILDPLDQFVVILDASLAPVYANRAAQDHPHITGEQLREDDFLRRARRVMSTGIADTQLPDPDDASDTVRVDIVRLQRRFLIVFAADLGEEQRLNTMRRDFIANVSHELKTPIAAISLLSEAIQEAHEEPALVKSFATRLRKEARRLGNLSRDIILLSEAQSTIGFEDRRPVTVSTIVHDEVEAHREIATQGGVELVIAEATAGAEDARTLGQASAIATALANVLSNAIRHSPQGARVGVGLEIVGETCVVKITDQGEGIPAEILPRIFERFYRVDESRSREGGGTGLGLSIARHTMRAHGGDVTVWSQPGVGSSFSLSLPLLDERKRKKEKKVRKRATKKATRKFIHKQAEKKARTKGTAS